MKSIFIGFDFSMNKPAATILYEKQFNFFIWPADITNKLIQQYNDAGVYVHNRGLQSVSTKKNKSSDLVLEHTIRSTNLANMIIEDIDDFINNILKIDKETPIYVSSEGLSFGSKGDAVTQLASYKGVLLSKMYEHYYGRMLGLWTYPPITMKSVAGCAKKGQLSNKNMMINAFMKENFTHTFKSALIQGKMINKTAYIPCVDDIVDSYWAVITMLKKEGFVK